MRLKSIAKQVVVIMGASSEIGRATALEFARRGAKLVVSARSTPGLASLVATIREGRGEAEAVRADAASFEQVQAVAPRAPLGWQPKVAKARHQLRGEVRGHLPADLQGMRRGWRITEGIPRAWAQPWLRSPLGRGDCRVKDQDALGAWPAPDLALHRWSYRGLRTAHQPHQACDHSASMPCGASSWPVLPLRWALSAPRFCLCGRNSSARPPRMRGDRRQRADGR
jgi:hypothetical protein